MVLEEAAHLEAVLAEHLVDAPALVLPVGAARRRDGIVIAETHDAREALRAIARQHHVIGLLHHLARDEDGIAHALQRGDRPHARAAALHHGGIELAEAIEIEDGTRAGVEDRIVLERHHRRADGVERAASGAQDRAALLHRVLHAGDRVRFGSHPPAAGAAVGDQRDRHY